jgi:hypothetical protein
MLKQIGPYLPAHTQAPVSLPGCELQLPYHPQPLPALGGWILMRNARLAWMEEGDPVKVATCHPAIS